jgi:Holliday junction DNA helicase RuvB
MFATSETSHGRITIEVARDALEMKNVDERGLDQLDRRYLNTLATRFHGGPVGVEAIAHTMSTARDTLEDDIEPFLLRIGFLTRTPRGRKLTPEGWEHLGLDGGQDQQDRQPTLF